MTDLRHYSLTLDCARYAISEFNNNVNVRRIVMAYGHLVRKDLAHRNKGELCRVLAAREQWVRARDPH